MKVKRQSKILELIRSNSIETQEELAEKLKEAGYEVTQATISRDIRELKLTKVPTPHGTQKYAVLTQNEQQISDKFIRVFRDGFVSMDRAQNILVIRTLTGMAMAVAAAMDAFHYQEIVGTIAGDDTIFCAVRSEDETIKLMEKLNRILNSD
ncbi:MAG: transcriptional regulator of arginine metabolism [Epulopiscium sp.]|jgi:transcriptional regulator of arginine metabolism|uniref:Arginine repressor n=1 Tax=Defluviitalea raffinosedens TaxID=1450156 RepID=A0A7C8LJ22_9FIRM|nr:arginine repressor [Defluviitalea raffinosedens]MBZ4669121.1 arginine repressor, ArgR [Defluviitaleaceae bacterium]MDK2789110.1 transcriptional regulator of arginine metabolism [Candidatus Epulonipiscium sp.]KAE9637220.1 arginine repressor [Defluviitalea raffinosedens]MBM7685520.1 transcriptional regulator of arginine metabolism [Defluviitalea raffinosedens]HHW66751.1 arginine repressor [Candidatus Epulonipiscium sp.]